MNVEQGRKIVVTLSNDEAEEIWTSLEEIKTSSDGQINALLNELMIKLQ